MLVDCRGCGCKPSIYPQHYESGNTQWHVQCRDYNCIPPGVLGSTRTEAIEKWNEKYKEEPTP